MEQLKHCAYHPSIGQKYTYLIEYIDKLPSKKSYDSAQECADEGLKTARTRFGEKVVNVHVLCGDKRLDSWKSTC